jgi:hypothetical protein
MILRFNFILLTACLLLFRTLFAEIPDCEIINYETTCRISNKKLLIERSLNIQINNRSGEYLTNISIPYDNKSKINDLKAWILDGNGQIIRKLNKNEITDVSAISGTSLYQDDYIKKFVLKHNEYPYIINFQYSISSDEFIHIINWFPVYNIKVPVQKAVLDVYVPDDYLINIYSKNIKSSVSDTVDGILHYKWEASYTDLIPDEIYSPPYESLIPCVHIVPVYFYYGTDGSYKDWKSYGNWQNNLNSGLNYLPESEKEKVKNLTGTLTDKKEIIKTLYHYMQDNTRYINVSIDIGGLKPYPASYVAKNKYGDCKALTNYMKSLLEIVGIKSYYTKIYAGDNPLNINKEFPSQQFNHVILTVPLQSDTIWLECTDYNNPFGYLGPFTQNRDALLIDQDNSCFIKTPALTLNDVCQMKKLDFRYGTIDVSQCVMNLVLRGEAFEYLSEFTTDLTEQEQSEMIHYVIPFRNYELVSWEIIKRGRDVPELLFKANVLLHDYAKKYSDMIISELYPSEIPLFESPEIRELPVCINYPICHTDTLTYSFPAGYTVTPADPLEFNSKYGSYSLTQELNNNCLSIFRTLNIYSGEYPLDEYTNLYSFFQTIINAERKMPIVLKNK